MKEVLDAGEARMKKTIEVMHTDLNKIRTGRPHPSLLDAVSVDYYGAQTPLSQVATITVEDGASLAISPWEKDLAPEIEKAILAANLGFNPSTQGGVIRIIMPPLNAERRAEYVRQAKDHGEKVKISLRNIRRDLIQEIKDMQKNGDISEDEKAQGEKQAQELIDRYIKITDEALAAKAAELTEV